ncbi:MAG: aminodeoxychorismate/anthranilate synthase component II [Planctomycetes bacterium]|nr:aminodeoxychorismate/anthranilate synthase component II [Planctomycetota bacterium]
MILLIDNYDSFVHNLARYFRRLGQETLVVRNDETTPDAIRDSQPQAIVLSPGPCTPIEAGCSLDVVREFAGQVPLLGICLGHQAIAAALGGKVVRAEQPMHGRTSVIKHQGSPLFASIPSPLTVCRYHSLVVEASSMPDELQVTASAEEGQVMAFQHSAHPVYGVQFHPEAVLTGYGYRLLANFLTLAGIPVDAAVEELAATEHLAPRPAQPPLPKQPITF